MELLTQSRMRTFRACAYKHALEYGQGWRPSESALPLRFGTLIHAALEVYWPMIATTGDIQAAADAAKRTLLTASAALDIDPYEQGKAIAMIEAYAARWAAEDMHYEVVGVEMNFRTPLVNPRTNAASRTWEMAGKLDGLVRDKRDGSLWVLEHKTTADSLSQGDASNYITRLVMDPQIGHYLIGALATGHDVKGVLYDVLGKPLQRPAKATPKDKRYKKDGGLKANARIEDESPQAYTQRVRDAISNDTDRFLHRTRIVQTDKDLADYADMAWVWADIMREITNKGRAPKNPDECDRFGRCHFWNHCAYGFELEDHPDLWRRATRTHEEL